MNELEILVGKLLFVVGGLNGVGVVCGLSGFIRVLKVYMLVVFVLVLVF